MGDGTAIIGVLCGCLTTTILRSSTAPDSMKRGIFWGRRWSQRSSCKTSPSTGAMEGSSTLQICLGFLNGFEPSMGPRGSSGFRDLEDAADSIAAHSSASSRSGSSIGKWTPPDICGGGADEAMGGVVF